MIRFFKNNVFINSLLLLPVIILFRFGAFVKGYQYVSRPNDTLVMNYLTSLFSHPLSQNILAVFLLYFQTLYINKLSIKHRLTKNITLIPGLLYLTMMSILPEYTNLNPYLIANTFVILALSQLFQTYKNPFVARLNFNYGLLIGLASLFVPSMIYLGFLGIIGLLVMRKFAFNEWLQVVFGIGIVYLFYYSGIFLYDINTTGRPSIYFSFEYPDLKKINSGMLWAATTIFFTIIAFLSYKKYTVKKSIQAHKKIDILFWLIPFSVLFAFFPVSKAGWSILLPFFIPLSIFMSINLLSIKNTFFQELLYLSMVCFLIVNHLGIF